MASRDDKIKLIRYARQGKLEGEGCFRQMLAEFVKVGTTGPGRQYGLDYCDKPFYRPALWEATWKNHEAIVKLLAEKNATIDVADYQNRTPLHEAAYYGYQNLVEYLLEKGHPIDPVDDFGQTPLFRAVDAGRSEIVELLVKRNAQTNLLDGLGTTVQHAASFHGMPDMAEWLLYKGAYKNRFSIPEEVVKEGLPPGALEDKDKGADDAGSPDASPASPTPAPEG
eukprot:TRINITY_DN43987_c0_g1_i1.p1 TRINITY_DN43987_c0_g1~~TRINITY_DN43987_c0_g1_i1.p1  ORF type:complete len:225 (+),score=51.42 TRINITY_DN43987_c0_g1_i1:59-733(+)